MEVGPFLRSKRKDAGLTVAESARQLKTTRFRIDNWERNLATPQSKYVKRMMLIYGFTLDEYLEGYRDTLIRKAETQIRMLKRRCS